MKQSLASNPIKRCLKVIYLF